jgi:hypothetical protein
MADKQVAVAEPEERVPESYASFAAFLAPNRERRRPSPNAVRRGLRGPGFHPHGHAQALWADDADRAAWLYRKLARPARA